MRLSYLFFVVLFFFCFFCKDFLLSSVVLIFQQLNYGHVYILCKFTENGTITFIEIEKKKRKKDVRSLSIILQYGKSVYSVLSKSILRAV